VPDKLNELNKLTHDHWNVTVAVVLLVSLPVPVTVKLYVPAEVPGLLWVVVAVPLPQALRVPRAAISIRMPSIERQLRRRAGIPKKSRMANSAPLPRRISRGPCRAAWDRRARRCWPLWCKTVMVAVPLVVVEFSVTVDCRPSRWAGHEVGWRGQHASGSRFPHSRWRNSR